MRRQGGRERKTESGRNVFHLLDGWVTLRFLPLPFFVILRAGGLLNLVLALSPDRQVGQHQPQNESTHTLSKLTHIWNRSSTEFRHISIQADCCTHTHTHTHTHTQTHRHTDTRTHARTHTHTHAHTDTDTDTHTHTRPRCITHSHQTCCAIFIWELGSSASRCRWGCSILIMSLESDVWLSINTKSHLRVWWGDQTVNKSTAATQHDKIWPLQNCQQAQANKNPCLSL